MANFFQDRVVQYPGRINLTPTEVADQFDLTRAEGTVTTAGTPFSAGVFNQCVDKYGMFYGTCTTGASTGTKAVACPGFALEVGASISVVFTNTSTNTGATYLNVNGTGAKQIRAIDTVVTGTYTRLDGLWIPQQPAIFVYDGTYWNLTNPVHVTEFRTGETTTAITTAGFTTWTDGASLDLDKGNWLVMGTWIFGVSSGTGSRNIGVRLYGDSGGETLHGEQRIITASGAAAQILKAFAVLPVSSQTTFKVQAASSLAITTATRNVINAIRM